MCVCLCVLMLYVLHVGDWKSSLLAKGYPTINKIPNSQFSIPIPIPNTSLLSSEVTGRRHVAARCGHGVVASDWNNLS